MPLVVYRARCRSDSIVQTVDRPSRSFVLRIAYRVSRIAYRDVCAKMSTQREDDSNGLLTHAKAYDFNIPSDEQQARVFGLIAFVKSGLVLPLSNASRNNLERSDGTAPPRNTRSDQNSLHSALGSQRLGLYRASRSPKSCEVYGGNSR